MKEEATLSVITNLCIDSINNARVRIVNREEEIRDLQRNTATDRGEIAALETVLDIIKKEK